MGSENFPGFCETGNLEPADNGQNWFSASGGLGLTARSGSFISACFRSTSPRSQKGPRMSELSQFLRDDVALIAKSKALGIHREIDSDRAKLAFIRAADEIENLEALVEDAVETLEAMDLHTNNPLYDRLRAAVET